MTIKLSNLIIPAAASLILFSTQASLLAQTAPVLDQGVCVTDLALAKGKNNYKYYNVRNKNNSAKVGAWDVDGRGANGRQKDLGSHWINLSAQLGPMHENNCLTDIYLKGGPDDLDANGPPGYEKIGYWDIDDGGSYDSNHNYSAGRMTLFIRKMTAGSPPESVIGNVWLNGTYDSTGDYKFAGYVTPGWWDVDESGAYGTAAAPTNNCSLGGCGNFMATLSYKLLPYTGDWPTAMAYSGHWQELQSCSGTTCNGISLALQIGVEEGNQISKESTVGRELSVMVGAEVTSNAGGAPGPAITAKVEVTGTFQQSQSDMISNSFTTSRSATTTVNCAKQSVLWQWVNGLQVTRPSGVENVKADTGIYRCTSLVDRPVPANNINWGLKKDMSWIKCAGEGGTCAFKGAKAIRYGANGIYETKTLTGPAVCSVATFEKDPTPNVLKSCETLVVWTHCAGEGGACDYSEKRVVRYGANGTYITKTLSGPITCGVSTFGGDPVPNVLKTCQID